MKWLACFALMVPLGFFVGPETTASAQSRAAAHSDSTTMPEDSVSGIVDYISPVPVVVFQPKVLWPKGISPRNLPVKVWCKVKVDTLGIVRVVRIVKSQNLAFNKSAKQLARHYRFQPTEVNGRKQDSWIYVPIIFRPTEHMQ